MSGDLISKSSLLQTLKYNKAINEDDAKGKMMVIPVDNVIEYVEKMPTSYNVDKVVEQLEDEKRIAFLTLANTGDKVKDAAYDEVIVYLNTAIEIVKAGGVE